ncbi:hypothetical protein UlMin_025464 [Ulmus minor]
MQYRRSEGFIKQSSASKSHVDHRSERDPNHYDNVARREGHHQARRSVSPHGLAQEVGVSQRTASKPHVDHRFERGPNHYDNITRREGLHQSGRSLSPHGMAQDVRTASIERREYNWQLDRGRAGQVRSRSPPPLVMGDARKRPHYDEGVGFLTRNYSPVPSAELQKRRELAEPTGGNFNDVDAELQTRRFYGYKPSDPRISKEKEFTDARSSAGERPGLLGQNSVVMEDYMRRGSYPPPGLEDTGGHLPSSSRNINTRHMEHEHGRPQYQDPITLDKSATQSYKDGEQSMLHLGDVSHHMLPEPHSKGFASSSSQAEFIAYQDDLHLPHSNELKSNVKLTESMGLDAHRERLLIGSARDPEGVQRNLTFYQRDVCTPTRSEHEDYLYPKSQEMAEDHVYQVDDSHETIPSRAQLDYHHTQIVYDHRVRDISRPNNIHPVVDRNENIEGSSGNLRKGITYYLPDLERQTNPRYFDMRRTSNISMQGEEYLESGFNLVEFGRKVSRNHETMHNGMPKDHHQTTYLEADYGFGRDAGPKFQEERLLSFPVSKYDTDIRRQDVRMQSVRNERQDVRMQNERQDVRMQSMRNERGMYKPPERVPKGRYGIQEGASTYNSRTLSRKVHGYKDFQDFNETSGEWINEDTSGLYTSRKTGYGNDEYNRAERNYGRLDHYEDFASDDWLSSPEYSRPAQKHSVGFYKHVARPRHTKGQQRHGYLSHYNSHHYDRRSHPYRQHKVWKRNYNYEDGQADDGNYDSGPSEAFVTTEEFVPAEDSEEFNQLVHEAFLKFSKNLNIHPGVQRRYKEQGKAGSLFCVVCGKSASKDFANTQRLVTHAFMSHKAGLRTEHLGLHKAICVLLGWSTVIPEETITWVPQVLPKEEALAQKEDLIIWPPVFIIHNISMSDHNPERWKVVSMEALEAFIRDKGLIRGRIKICLGKPADQSVMVVKFLGTFSGLGDAEKLHKNFAESKRGRVDFEVATSNNGEININTEGGKVEENIFYGYVGIAEDLDKVDFSTRNTCLIKSKREILELANDPVKPEETKQELNLG